jgi:hypothetical protein
MQSPKCLLTICAAGFALSVFAGDNPDQIKAREALEKQLNTSPSQAQPAAPAAAVPAKPAAVPQAPAPVAQPPTDPDAIAKARAAMEQKLKEMQGQAPTTAPAPAPVAAQPPPPKRTAQPKVKAPPPATPAPAPAPVPVVQAPAADAAAIEKARRALREQATPPATAPAQPAVVAQPPPAAPAPVPPPALATTVPAAGGVFSPVPASDPQAIEKARQALRDKIGTIEAETSTPGAPPPPPTPSTATVPVVTGTVQTPSTPGINSPPEADPAAIAKAREAVRQTMDTSPAAQPSAPAIKASRTALNFPAIQGPALPISSDKQQRLQSLLQQYRMDLISPEQYQASRAKILAEP